MKSPHWQIALSDPVITFPGAATQFALASFCQNFLLVSLKNFYWFPTTLIQKEHFSREHARVGKKRKGELFLFN